MGHGPGSVASDVRDSGDAGLGPPVSGVCPHRPLLLRSDVPWTPEGSAREPSASEEGREYVFPQGVMDRLAVQEALSDAARQRRKRKKEDEAAELDDAADGTGCSSSSRRDEDTEGGGQGAAGEGCPLA